MQIKFYYKMAKNDALITFCANTVQENERMLQELCSKNQVDTKSKENFEKLFIRLNYLCQMKFSKEESQLNSSWCNKNVINYIYGPITGFPSGSWWGIRMDCSRDRVHDPFDENVQNGPFGVTSVCTSSINLNEDVDFGNSLTITGQRYLNGDLEKDPLVKNYENQIPVRLIRSYNLFNEFAPKTGYRYDGLYVVTNFWIGINSDSVKHYKFALLRLNDQEPPSWNSDKIPLVTSTLTSTISTSAPSQNCINNSSPNVYEFKKYSHGSESAIQRVKQENVNGFPQFPNVENNKKINEREKGAAESAIVTRHVFKKVNTNTECASNVPNVSIATENKSLTHIGNQSSKTHNTNISIRTGLYDSSHSTQHDNKKSILSPFCRTSKSLNALKTNQHLENWNLSNSKEKSRNADGKVQSVASNECPKRVNYVSFNAIKAEPIKIGKDSNAEVNSNEASSNSCYRLECNIARKEITKDCEDTRIDSPDATTNMLNMTNCMYKNENPTHKAPSKEEQELKSLDSLDSLTPDRILHLINSKNNPLSKLLMGNMIGLTSEQTRALQTRDLRAAELKAKDKTATRKSNTEGMREKTKFEVASDDLSGSRCYKFRRRKKLPRKLMNVPEMIKYKKIHNEKLRNGTVQSSEVSEYSRKETRVQKREANGLRDPERSIASKREGRMHLRAVRRNDSARKKHVNKKQKRREIANLLIDAKIGPKIRGPRYRRLRSINNNTYAKQSPCEHFDSAICVFDKRKVNSERSTFESRNKLAKLAGGCKTVKSQQGMSVNRSETLNLRRGKMRNFPVSRKIGQDHAAKRVLRNSNNDDNNRSDNNKKSKFLEGSVKRVDNKDIAIRKRKLMQTVCREPKSSKMKENEISKPCKTDAVTQCSLIREPLARNLKTSNLVRGNVRNEQHTFIKIEYGDFKDMKSETCEAMKSDDENKDRSSSRSEEKYASCTESISNVQHPTDANVSLNNLGILDRKEGSNFSVERVSAFVPVNIPDNDLKIARLRSIGFKPINFGNSDEDASNQDRENKVVKRDVAEKYDKYTNEENDIVVYMDEELQYQDIENEDKNSLPVRCKASDSKVFAVKDERLSRMVLEKESFDLLFEQELESPWHGWKKVVTNKDTYWVGW